MVRERKGHTLQTTALVNEAFMRLVDANQVPFENRTHFFAISANLMRRVLVDFARSRGDYQKRGANVVKVEFDGGGIPAPKRRAGVVALDDALNALAAFDEREAKGSRAPLIRWIERRGSGGRARDLAQDGAA